MIPGRCSRPACRAIISEEAYIDPHYLQLAANIANGAQDIFLCGKCRKEFETFLGYEVQQR